MNTQPRSVRQFIQMHMGWVEYSNMQRLCCYEWRF